MFAWNCSDPNIFTAFLSIISDLRDKLTGRSGVHPPSIQSNGSDCSPSFQSVQHFLNTAQSYIVLIKPHADFKTCERTWRLKCSVHAMCIISLMKYNWKLSLLHLRHTKQQGPWGQVMQPSAECVCVCVDMCAIFTSVFARERNHKGSNYICYCINSFFRVGRRGNTAEENVMRSAAAFCPSLSSSFAKVHQSVSNSNMKNGWRQWCISHNFSNKLSIKLLREWH